MQPLTAAPWRSQFTEAQIVALLTGPAVSLVYGLELLDQNNNLISDISDSLVSWSVQRTNTNTIQGALTLTVTQNLQGGWQRVRPYVLMTGDDGSGNTITARFDEGVYILTTPTAALNELTVELGPSVGGAPPALLPPQLTWSMQGSDLMYLLDEPIGDSYGVAAGISYLSAIQDVVTAAGLSGSAVLLDGSAGSSVVPAALGWPLLQTATNTSAGTYAWIDVINQLLEAINYLPLWADWEGNFRSGPYLAPGQLTPEFTMDLTLARGVLVADPRTMSSDLWQMPNRWVYINDNVQDPVLGAGVYIYVNQSTGPSSVAAVRNTISTVVNVSVVDQAALQGLAAQQINQAIQLTQQLAVTVAPFPACWQFDVFTYVDANLPLAGIDESVTVQSQGWSLASDGSDGAQAWDIVGAPVVT